MTGRDDRAGSAGRALTRPDDSPATPPGPRCLPDLRLNRYDATAIAWVLIGAAWWAVCLYEGWRLARRPNRAREAARFVAAHLTTDEVGE